MMGATRALARFAATLGYGDLPAQTVDIAKRLLLDGLGCLLVGTQGGPARSAAATMRRLGGLPQATLFAGGFKTSVRNAAFANGVTLYSVGLNDIHKPSTSHPGGCIIPVLLALGEWRDAGGRELIAAMVAGYDVNARVGTAVAPSHRERGFQPTGTVGTFAATAAAGRMLALDEDALASAFGIAGSQAAGLYEFHHDGTLTMIFHAGRAAQNGVEAALLVQDGLSGPATILEGDKGFCHATADRFDEDALTRDLGEKFLIHETSFRPYYGCSSTIAASGATAQLLKSLGLAGDDVADVEVLCHPVVAKDNFDPNPTTLLGARLSMQYNLALVMDRGEVVTADLGEHDLWNSAIRERMGLVRLTGDTSMPRFGATVKLRTRSGREGECANPLPRGDATVPLTWDDVAAKFGQMAGPLCGAASVAKIVDIVNDLENLPVERLTRALASAVSAPAG
jgi:2-methylcitrate dehydratase PrpD